MDIRLVIVAIVILLLLASKAFSQPPGVIVQDGDCWVLIPDRLETTTRAETAGQGYYEQIYHPPVVEMQTINVVTQQGGIISYHECLPDGSVKKCYKEVPEITETVFVPVVVTQGWVEQVWVPPVTYTVSEVVVVPGGWKNDCTLNGTGSVPSIPSGNVPVITPRPGGIKQIPNRQ